MSRPRPRLGLRLRSLFFRARVERELDDELQYHLDREIEARLAAGLAPEEARAAARRSLGAMVQSMEECRDVRGLNVIDHRIQDLRFALRQLVKHPGFVCTVIVTLALGLAANVAIFGFVDATLIRPLPYTDQARLVAVFATYRDKTGRGPFSYLDYVDLRERNRAFRSIDAYDVRTGLTLTTSEGSERVTAPRVTAGFFRTLGVTPVLGRGFEAGDEGPSAPATVLLAHATWQTRFGGREDVLGQTLTLEGEPHIVIGVLPRDFHFTLTDAAEFWLTIRGNTFATSCWQRRGCRSLQVLARLPDGVSPQAAVSNLAAVMQYLRQQNPESNRDVDANLVPLRELMVGDVRPILLVFLSGAGLLLLIAGINVCSLLLARSDSRTREIAVRNALGASSIRLLSQFATEAVVLVGAGSVLGLTLAAWAMRLLMNLLSADMVARLPYLQGIGLNLRLVTFAGVVSFLAAVVFALTPVLRVSMSERFAGLKEGSRGSAGTSWRRFGAYLVVSELAIAVILLVGAGLLGKSLYRLLRVDSGMNLSQLATLTVGAAPGEASKEHGSAFARQIAERLAAVPGVQAVGYADRLPLSPGAAPASTFWIVGRPELEQRDDSHPVRRVSAGYFSALHARLLRGRYFTDAEVASARPLLIINQTTAQRYFRGEDPIGQAIAFGRPGSAERPTGRQIVGVIADIKDGPLETPARPAAYVPFDQHNQGAFVVRTSQPERAVLPSLVAALRQHRRGLSISGEMTMTDRMNQLPSAHLHRSAAWVVGGFAVVAFILSVVGLYGIVAYSVGQRTREIGVRMALGAERRSVYRLVLGEAAWLVCLGSLVGMVCAVAAATLMRRLLFGVESWDPTTLGGVVATLIVSALLASYVPARRAALVNPTDVMRAE